MQFFLVTTSAQLEVALKTIRNIERFLAPSAIHVIAGGGVTLFRDRTAQAGNIRVHDEKEFAPHIDLHSIAAWPVFGFPDRANWYYQQFLKMAVAESAIAEDQFVIWDADTVPYHRITFFNVGNPCFTVHDQEFHLPYFQTNDRLIGVARHKKLPGVSAVSQHMPVDKSRMKALLAMLSAQSEGSWLETIRKAIIDREGMSLFSEYELYFDYITAVEKQDFDLVCRPWYRFGASCTRDQLLFLRHASCFVAYETWDKRTRFSIAEWSRRWTDLWVATRTSRSRVIAAKAKMHSECQSGRAYTKAGQIGAVER